jgi:ADP-heptose:LPS heptosyltransferase
MINLDNKKILLVRNDNVGDLICTTPAIEALRKQYPSAKIDIVVNSYNYDAIYNNPYVDNIYCYTKPKHKKSFIDKLKAALGKIKIILDIKKENYDAVVVFRSGYSRSAELFANITKAKYKVGVKDPKSKDNFNIHIDVDPNSHEVEFCFDCLKSFGVTNQGENTYYYIDDKISNKYIKYKDHILFHISSRIKENQYSKENFKKLIDKLDMNNILISAEPIDFDAARWLDNNTNATFVQTSSLQDLGGIIKNVKLFITLDGGAMHLGPAVGTKTISISGKTNMDKWYPWAYKHLVIQDDSRIANNIDNQKIVDIVNEAI